MHMSSYGSKIAALVKQIAPRVRFSSIHKAEEIATWYSQPSDSEIYQKVHRMAENLFDRQVRYGLSELLDNIGACRQTKLSALREAIMLNAVNYYVECSADKIMRIVEIIEPLVEFTTAEQANEYANWDAESHDSDTAHSVYAMAEALLEHENALDELPWILGTVGSSTHAKLSALREAIKRTAERSALRFAKMAELEDLVLIGEMGEPTERELMATA